MLANSRSASPVFLISSVVTDEPFGKSSTGGLISRFGTGVDVPVPARITVTRGVDGSLLEIVKTPLNRPVAGGWNCTVSSMLPLGAMVSGVAGFDRIVNGPVGF